MSTDCELLPELPAIDGSEARHVAGWPGYAITDAGVLYTCRDNNGGTSWPWSVRKPKIDKDGYEDTTLWNCGRKRFVKIHVLVCEAFHGPRPSGMVVRHKDGNCRNNHKDNLTWGTESENCIDRVIHGRNMLCRKGIAHPAARLTDEQVREILSQKHDGDSGVLAERYGVSSKYVCELWRRGGRDTRKRKRGRCAASSSII